MLQPALGEAIDPRGDCTNEGKLFQINRNKEFS